MRDQEIISLYGAYQQVYAKEEISEEVEIAAQYFYEMGLNEDGVDILIEELGVEEFAEFVYDIAEEYMLTEARAGGVKIEPKLASGKEIKGKPKAASLKRLRAQKAERREAEEKASAEKPSGMKASLQRQSAIAASAKKQPKKPGLLDRVAGAVNKGIKRHNKAMGELNKMKSATAVTVGKVKKAAGEFKKGLASEEFKMWVNSLIEEGYDLSEYSWDDMYEIYMNEGYDSTRGRGERGEPTRTQHLKVDPEKYAKDMEFWRRRNEKSAAKFRMQKKGTVPKKDGKEMFEHVLEYLVAEGYADTNKAALAIMANMSEDWREEIVESRVSELGDRLKDLKQRSATSDTKAQNTSKLARERLTTFSKGVEKFSKDVESLPKD